MRQAGALLAGLALAGALVGLIGDENRIDNPGLEVWKDDDPVAWEVPWGEASKDPAAPFGDLAAKLTPKPDGVSAGVLQPSNATGGDAPIIPGAEYEFKFWAHLDRDGADGSQEVWAMGVLFWTDIEGNRLEEDVTYEIDGQGFFGGQFKAPTEAAGAEILFGIVRDDPDLYEDASLRVDQVLFQRT